MQLGTLSNLTETCWKRSWRLCHRTPGNCFHCSTCRMLSSASCMIRMYFHSTVRVFEVSHHVISRDITLHHVISRCITWHHVTAHDAAWLSITDHHVPSRAVTNRHGSSRHITRYHATSRDITETKNNKFIFIFFLYSYLYKFFCLKSVQ
jgi:hypothetical protein